ncbi:hypothetical protein QP888_04385 [Corynebacterium sp. MSK297]|uniref:hypothetical protein n=1 Tax=Corynebacterium sp. MSK297 TaxID=3050221 RepID=UPI00254CA38F|nr:hypothetical protein [Corynebacterium sp. MSK297]MDK8845761.1 hypothetical protein [Corynebacterium sp. MSK297]
MKPTIIDKDTGRELWLGEDCASFIGASPATWRTYSANGRTPGHVATILGNSRLWDAGEVRAGHGLRPGSPVRNSPGHGV